MTPNVGLRLFRTSVVTKLFNEITINGFAFDTEVLLKAFSHGLRVKEVPIIWTHGTSSKVSVLREIRSMGSDILSLWYYYHRYGNKAKQHIHIKRAVFMLKSLFVLLLSNYEIESQMVKCI